MSDGKSQSFFARMRAKINRPGSWLSYDLANIVPGRKIDAEVLEELETRLLSADVGVEATEQILEELRKKVARKELDDADKLIAALTDAIVALLLPVQQPLDIATHKPFVLLVVGQDHHNRQARTPLCRCSQARGTGGGRHISSRRRRTARHLGFPKWRGHHPAAGRCGSGCGGFRCSHGRTLAAR
jgi:hypothetical protein